MNEEPSVDIFKLPNPGNYLLLTVLLFLSLGLVVLVWIGIFSAQAHNAALTNVLLAGSSINALLPGLKLISINTSYLPVTTLIFSFIIALIKPLYFEFLYSPIAADDELSNRLQLALSIMQVKKDIKIQVSKKKVPAQIYNFRHPTILLSESAIAEKSIDELDTIILHEIAHYKNKDIIAVEISKAVIFALVIQLFISLALLALIALPFLDIADNSSKMLLLSEATKTTTEAIINTVLINLATPIVVFAFVVIIYIANNTIHTYRERRADLQVSFLSSRISSNLIKTVAKGTRKSNILEKILQIGSDRWTRHETLVDPQRLLRPNTGLAILFGATWAILFALIGNIRLYFQDMIEFYEKFNISVILAINILSKMFFIGYFFWFLVGILSSLLYEPNNNKRWSYLVSWYIKMNFFFSASMFFTSLLLGIPLAKATNYLVVYFLIPVFNPIYIMTISFASIAQSLVLESYLVTPRRKEKLAFWLVYYPLGYSAIVNIILELSRFVFAPDIYQYYQLLEAKISAPNFEYKPDIILQFFFGGFQYASVPLIFLGAAVGIVSFIAIFFLNSGYFQCCCCGADAKMSFSIHVKCSNCGYPLGMWISSKQPSIEEFYENRNQFDWEAVSRHNFRESLLACFAFSILIAIAYFCYYLFSSHFIVSVISSWFIRFVLGIIAFILLVIGLLITVSVYIYLFRKDILLEIQNTRLERQLSSTDDKNHDS